ncbi:MAG: hypothetical protein K8L99_13755 [Anaerolineae bacterium]|nr:hypothetical protein [Anaerolineae bacterium]
MLRLHFKLALRITLALLVVITLICTQPRDDHVLRDLLLPQGCAAPCFMGIIQPGVTPIDTALDQLSQQPQISRMDTWQEKSWYGLHLQGESPLDQLDTVTFRAANGKVTTLLVQTTHLPLGDIWLALGQPARILAYDDGLTQSQPVVAAYPAEGLFVYIALVACELDPESLWRQSGTWIGIGYPVSMAQFPRLGLPEMERIEMLSYQQLSLTSWIHQLHTRKHCN